MLCFTKLLLVTILAAEEAKAGFYRVTSEQKMLNRLKNYFTAAQSAQRICLMAVCNRELVVLFNDFYEYRRSVEPRGEDDLLELEGGNLTAMYYVKAHLCRGGDDLHLCDSIDSETHFGLVTRDDKCLVRLLNGDFEYTLQFESFAVVSWTKNERDGLLPVSRIVSVPGTSTESFLYFENASTVVVCQQCPPSSRLAAEFAREYSFATELGHFADHVLLRLFHKNKAAFSMLRFGKEESVVRVEDGVQYRGLVCHDFTPAEYKDFESSSYKATLQFRLLWLYALFVVSGIVSCHGAFLALKSCREPAVVRPRLPDASKSREAPFKQSLESDSALKTGTHSPLDGLSSHNTSKSTPGG